VLLFLFSTLQVTNYWTLLWYRFCHDFWFRLLAGIRMSICFRFCIQTSSRAPHQGRGAHWSTVFLQIIHGTWFTSYSYKHPRSSGVGETLVLHSRSFITTWLVYLAAWCWRKQIILRHQIPKHLNVPQVLTLFSGDLCDMYPTGEHVHSWTLISGLGSKPANLRGCVLARPLDLKMGYTEPSISAVFCYLMRSILAVLLEYNWPFLT